MSKPNSETTELLETQNSTHGLDVDADQDSSKMKRAGVETFASNTTNKRSFSLNHTPTKDDGRSSSYSRPLRQE